MLDADIVGLPQLFHFSSVFSKMHFSTKTVWKIACRNVVIFIISHGDARERERDSERIVILGDME